MLTSPKLRATIAVIGIGRSGRFPWIGRQPGEGEEPRACLFQAVGDRLSFEPPLAQEGFAALLDLLGGGGIVHVLVVGRDLAMQRVGCMVNRAGFAGGSNP